MPNGSFLAIFIAILAIMGNALRIPAAESDTLAIIALPLQTSTPGFSIYIPVTTGIFNCSVTAFAISPQAIPYLPALKAGPVTTISGLFSFITFNI